MIEIRYVLQIEDFMDAIRASYASDKRGKRVRIAMIVIGIAIVPLVFYTRSFGAGRGLPYWMIPLGLGLAWSGLQSPALRLKTYYKKSVTNEKVIAQIDEGGVTTESPTARTEMKWVGFSYALETPNTFSLFTIANLLFVFPKRAFSEQSCEEFRKIIVQNGIPTKPR
jgi:hypothetical protein